MTTKKMLGRAGLAGALIGASLAAAAPPTAQAVTYPMKWGNLPTLDSHWHCQSSASGSDNYSWIPYSNIPYTSQNCLIINGDYAQSAIITRRQGDTPNPRAQVRAWTSMTWDGANISEGFCDWTDIRANEVLVCFSPTKHLVGSHRLDAGGTVEGRHYQGLTSSWSNTLRVGVPTHVIQNMS